MKILDKKNEVNLCDLKLGNGFFNVLSKGKLHVFNFIKRQNFGASSLLNVTFCGIDNI
jgi:hypothetical protein